jgi:transposase-like protein
MREVELPGGKLLVDTRAPLLDMLMTSGAQVMMAMLESDVAQLCGPSYHRHGVDGTASRWGETGGEVIVGGRKAAITRPRVRRGKREVKLPLYEHWQRHDPLSQRVVEQVLIGVSSRHYKRSLEALPTELADLESFGTGKSAVSRRLVALTEAKVAEQLSRPLTDEYLALMLDGLHLGEHTVITALGVTSGGDKHMLGAWEGATENSQVCQMLLNNLRDRGFPTTVKTLVVLDGAKALRKAVNDTLGANAVVQRCQEHKKRNVMALVPRGMQTSVKMTLNQVFVCDDYDRADQMLNNLARRLDRECPGAAASLREGMPELLTVLKLGLPKVLRRSLSSTNLIENTQGTIQRVARGCKRWKDGAMALRWVVTGLSEATQHFTRLRGYRELTLLKHALGREEIDKTTAVEQRGRAA